MPRLTLENVEDVLSFHSPNAEQIAKYAAVNEAAVEFTKVLLTLCPEGRETSLALTHLQDARHWANSAIAMAHLED